MDQLDLFDQPIPLEITRLTFNQAMRLFVDVHWSKTAWGRSRRADSFIRYMIAYFDGRFIDTLGRQDVVNMRKHLEVKNGLGLSSINKAHTILKLMYSKFEAWQSDGWAEGFDFSKLVLPRRNPAKLVYKPRDPSSDRFLTPWEFRKLVKYAKRLNDWDMVDTLKMGIWCRLSPIDLENLNDDEIDETRFQIELRRRHTIAPRTPQGVLQIVPMTERMWGLIDRRRKYRKPGDKRILNFLNFRRRFGRLRKMAVKEGMKDFTLQAFRRSGSGYLWEQGTPLEKIAEGMGHTTTKATKEHYIPNTRPHLRKPTEALVKAFND